MDERFYADGLRLKEHEDIIRQERQTAQTLCEQLQQVSQYMPPDSLWRCKQMCDDAERLTQYFIRMNDQVELIGSELEQLSLEINALLRDAGRG